MQPTAIIFVNNDISASIQSTLERQLFTTETITGQEFEARLAADPNYPSSIHLNNLRLLVLYRFPVVNNRQLADVIIFEKSGLAYIEDKTISNHGEAFDINRLTLEKLLAGNSRSGTIKDLNDCKCPDYCYYHYLLHGDKIFSSETYCKKL